MKNFWENKKVLVTGGTGFIGSNMVRELIKRQAAVTVSVQNNISNLPERVKIEKADLTNMEDCLRVTKNIDIILNFAALDGGSAFKKEHAAEMFKNNVTIVLNILEASRLNNIDRVLLMSSIDVYSGDTKSPIKEDDGFLGDFSKDKYGYAWSKRFSEIAAKTYYNQYGLKIAIARVGNVYGLNDFKGVERGRVIPTFIDKAKKNEDIVIWGNGLQKKSFLYVEDLVEALLNLTEKYPACDPVNIASSEYLSLKDLGELIIELYRSKSKIIFQKTKNEESIDKIININKAKKNINFKERTSLCRGIQNK